MRKFEDVWKKYVLKPDVSLYAGFEYDGEDIDLCDDHDEDKNYDFKVRQKIVDGVMITDMSRRYTMNNEKIVSENSHQEVGIEKGQKLVYVQGLGFTIPDRKVCELDEAIGYYNILKGETDESTGNEKESTEAN